MSMSGDKKLFRDLIREMANHEVIQVSDEHPILDLLETGLKTIINQSKYTLYQRKRVNEVGKSLEELVRDALERKSSVRFVPNKQHAGYPDLCFNIDDTYVFLEVKATEKPEEETNSQRRFYISSGKKIKHDGYHLLVLLYLQPQDNSHRLRSWKIQDLYSLELKLKKEWNASSNDFKQLHTLRHSQPQQRHKRVGILSHFANDER